MTLSVLLVLNRDLRRSRRFIQVILSTDAVDTMSSPSVDINCSSYLTAEAPVLFSQLFIRDKHSRMHIFNPFVTTNNILHLRTHSKSQQLPMTDSFTDLDHLAACIFYNYTMYSDALLCTAPAMFSSTELNWFTTLCIRLRNKSVASDWCSTIWQKTSLQACNC